jgi:hypothetical protein
LISLGADPNILSVTDASAVHLAAGTENHSEFFTALMLQQSANPNLL